VINVLFRGFHEGFRLKGSGFRPRGFGFNPNSEVGTGLLWSRRDCGQAGGGSFVPEGTLDKATREPSDQSLGYFLSPSGLDGRSPASEASLAGLGQTGLLAANAFRIFPAFIFKNALAANIGIGSRLKVSGFRRQDADRQRDAQVRDRNAGRTEMGFGHKKAQQSLHERLMRRQPPDVWPRPTRIETDRPKCQYLDKSGQLFLAPKLLLKLASFTPGAAIFSRRRL